MQGRSISFWTAIFFLPALLVLQSSRVQAAEAGASPAFQTLAVADPAVLGPEPGDAWLGAAVAELLKAKLQFLKKVRLVERERLEPHLAQLRDAGRDEEEAGADRRRAALLVPAEAFCVGSITVDRRGEAARLAVRLRLVQTATGTVLAKMTVEAASDLPGLLSLAGQLAQELAAALGETLDASALAYREPERLDALKLHAEGLQRLAAGEHREAVAALTAALEGNGGVFYPAAHRDLGAVYRAWAQSLTGAAAEGVRQEYLERFKQDALLAATALFDLGVAYQENGLHQEAIGAFTDYLAAVGEEGKRARWSLTRQQLLDAVARLPGAPDPQDTGTDPWAGIEGNILHYFVRGLWVRIDVKTGAVLTAVNLPSRMADGNICQPMVVSGDRLIVKIRKDGPGAPRWDSLGTVAPDGSLGWIVGDLEKNSPSFLFAHDGYLYAQGYFGTGVYALEDGRLVGVLSADVRSPMYGLDLGGNRLVDADGVLSLPTGRRIGSSAGPAREERYAWKGLPLKGIRYPTGVPGVEWTLTADATPTHLKTVLLRAGEPVRELGPCLPRFPTDSRQLHRLRASEELQAALPGARFCIFECLADAESFSEYSRARARYVLVDTRDGVTHNLFGGSGQLPAVIWKGEDAIVFGGDEAACVVDASTGRIIGRETLVHEALLDGVMIDGDLVVATPKRVARVRMPQRKGPVLIPVAEAHLRIVGSLLEHGDLAAAARSIQAFAAEAPGDPREHLALMRLESGRARSLEASTHALAALRSPLLEDRDIRACLEVLRRTNPEYRSFIRFPTGIGRLRLRGMTDDGVIVAQGGGALHLIDSGTGSVRSVPSSFAHTGVLRLEFGRPLFFRFMMILKDGEEREGTNDWEGNPWRLDRLEITAGELEKGEPVAMEARHGELEFRQLVLHAPILDPAQREAASLPVCRISSGSRHS